MLLASNPVLLLLLSKIDKSSSNLLTNNRRKVNRVMINSLKDNNRKESSLTDNNLMDNNSLMDLMDSLTTAGTPSPRQLHPLITKAFGRRTSG